MSGIKFMGKDPNGLAKAIAVNDDGVLLIQLSGSNATLLDSGQEAIGFRANKVIAIDTTGYAKLSFDCNAERASELLIEGKATNGDWELITKDALWFFDSITITLEPQYKDLRFTIYNIGRRQGDYSWTIRGWAN